jgi:hypothetical protein
MRFIKEPRSEEQTGWDQERDTVRIEITHKEESLSNVVRVFEDFLKACGYSFEGHLDFVEDE